MANPMMQMLRGSGSRRPNNPIAMMAEFRKFAANMTPQRAQQQVEKLLADGIPLPAYDQCIKASHLFNLLDARGVISVTERAAYIGRVRALAKGCCEGYLKSRGHLTAEG